MYFGFAHFKGQNFENRLLNKNVYYFDTSDHFKKNLISIWVCRRIILSYDLSKFKCTCISYVCVFIFDIIYLLGIEVLLYYYIILFFISPTTNVFRDTCSEYSYTLIHEGLSLLLFRTAVKTYQQPQYALAKKERFSKYYNGTYNIGMTSMFP